MIYVYYSASCDIPKDYVSPAYFEAKRNDKECYKILENTSKNEIRILKGNIVTDTLTIKAGHYSLIKELIKTLKPECTVVFPDVMSLSSDNEEATNLYLELLTRGIYVQFLESPWLNTSHMRLIFRENPIEARGIAINSFMSTLIWKLKDHSLAEPVNVTVTQASMEIKKNEHSNCSTQ